MNAVEISYQIVVHGETKTRTTTVPQGDVERTIDKLLTRGAFNFETKALS